VTTDDVGLSLADLGIDITAWQAELAASVREAREAVQSIEAAFANIQADTLGNIAQLRTDLAVAFSDNSAKWSNEVQVFAGPNSSAVLRQEIIQAQLDASTVSINAALGVSAATIDGATTLLAAAVTSLQATVPGLATVSALSALTVTVTTNTSDIAGNTSDITINAAAITALQGQLGNTGANAIFSMNVGYTPSAGWTSAAAIQTSVTAGGATSTAGIVFEAKTGSSRTVLIGDSVVVQNGGTVAAVFKAGAAFLNVAMIENASILSAKIGNLEVKTANIDSLSVTTAKIGNNAVTASDFAFTAANTTYTTETTIQTLSFTPANGVVLVKASAGIVTSGSDGTITTRLKRAGTLVSAQATRVRTDAGCSVVLFYIDTSPGASAISWTLTAECLLGPTGNANQRYIECVNLVK
jgi:hypothetical protein